MQMSPRDMLMQTEKEGGHVTAIHLQPYTRRRWAVSITLLPLCPLEIPGAHCTGDWLGLGVGLDATESLPRTAIRFPDPRAHKEVMTVE